MSVEDLSMFKFLYSVLNRVHVAYVGTYPPRECGIATFTQDLTSEIDKFTPFSKSRIVAMNDRGAIYAYGDKVFIQVDSSDEQAYITAAEALNKSNVDLINIQHEFGIFGGEYGEYLLTMLKHLRKPVVTTLHTVLPNPAPKMRDIVQKINYHSQALVVMVKKGAEILFNDYGLDADKMYLIPHGVPNVHRWPSMPVKKRLGLGTKTIMSTFGLINRGKGIEHVIDALPAIVDKHPDIIYLILGQTHPGVRRHEGENYRDMLLQKVHDNGLINHVRFNNRYMTKKELVDYLLATDVYVTPYLSKDQICSGALAYAVGAGKAIVSTPYLYAREVLANGRGLLTEFEYPDGIAECVCNILGSSELRQQMELKTFKYGRKMSWHNVAIDYLDLFDRILSFSSRLNERMISRRLKSKI